MRMMHWQPPINPSDADQVSKMIQDTGGIVSAIPQLRNADWWLFSEQHLAFKVKFRVTIDSNFLIHLVNLFKHRTKRSQMDKRTAALMAFALMFDMQINPTVAVFEYATTAKGDPQDILAKFRYADNMFDPQNYADLALGRKTSIPAPSQAELLRWQQSEPPLSSVKMKGYEAHYTALLGLLAIHTDPTMGKDTIKNRKRRILRFMEWMHSDFIFIGYATILASFLWGQGKASALLRNPNTNDSAKLIANAKNTTWDLSLAHAWSDMEVERDGQQGIPVNLLFTMDRGLSLIAGRILQDSRLSDYEGWEYFYQQLLDFWPKKEAEEIARIEHDYKTRLDDASRKLKSPNWQAYAQGLSEKLEKQIRKNLQEKKSN